MDLRKYINNESDLNKAIKFIKNGTLFYQPFIIHDNIIIGEARNFIKQYSDVKSIYDYNLYSKNFPELETVNGVKRNLISENEKDFFIKINNEYDFLYEFCVNEIIKELNEPIENLSFAEIGSNTGITLLKLCEKGAKECYGYDWTDYSQLYAWYKNLMNININFRQCGWDNLYHRMLVRNDHSINLEKIENFFRKILKKPIHDQSNYSFEKLLWKREKHLKSFDVPEVDVMLNTVFTNHQFDPMQFIAYCCDRSKKAVFFWSLVDIYNPDHHTLFFPGSSPHEEIIISEDRDFPLNVNNNVRMTEKLFKHTLSQCGFANIKKITPEVSQDFYDWGIGKRSYTEIEGSWRLYIATRTSDKKSAFYKNKI
tara:strand:- start:486 stop:1592 length:1107 start_codon:yes stop_codon:yes gene_type:complete